MLAYRMKSNIIKWWQITYNPTVRMIFPSKYERDKYEEEMAMQASITEDLKSDPNYNASTGSMSGSYGKGEMDDAQKAQLDSILKSNYSSVAGIDALLQSGEPELTEEEKKIARLCDTSNLSAEEAAAKQEQIRKANEIYERLLQEARQDEEMRQAEIEAAKVSMDAVESSETS